MVCLSPSAPLGVFRVSFSALDLGLKLSRGDFGLSSRA
jgi:hypothetical protein